MCGVSKFLFIFFQINQGNIDIHSVQSDSKNISIYFIFIFSQFYAKVSDYGAVGLSIHILGWNSKTYVWLLWPFSRVGSFFMLHLLWQGTHFSSLTHSLTCFHGLPGLSHPFLGLGPGTLWIQKIIDILGKLWKIAHLLNEEQSWCFFWINCDLKFCLSECVFFGVFFLGGGYLPSINFSLF